MRSGGYTLHHSLTVEAAAIVKQAVSLARRRGHAQVTPLHVASAMLSSPAGLLKRACLHSHSHPLQCKALELCFNVALNRLPTSASTPLLGPQSHLPSLSNALVAAFKRAQAHQRRGSIENQQQPILALKVEIEQLVVSILDDPSVSRVMREAGFSSTQVKANVEQAVSMEKCTPHQPPTKEFIISSSSTSTNTNTNTNLSQFRYNNNNNNNNNNHNSYSNSEVESVLEAMADKQRKNAVIVGECAEANERVVRKVIEKFDKKDVPSEMKSVQFISVPLSTLRNVSKEEFEVKVGELRSLVKSYVGRGGVVLYLGDLDWVSELWSNHHHQRDDNHVHVEYMIMELSRLVCGENNIIDYYKQQQHRLWLMGIATFQTYAKCKMGRPSLETLWSLNPLTLPLRTTLALGLTLHSGMHDQVVVKKEVVEDDDDDGNMRWLLRMKKQLVCCSDCSDNFKKEAEAVMVSSSSTSRLPSWLQQYKDDENRKRLGLHLNNNININLQESDHDDKVKDLCKKWNSICRSVHKKPHFLEKVLNLSSSSTSPSPSTSVSSSDRNKSKIQQTLVNWPPIFEQTRDHQYEVEVSKPAAAAAKPELLSNPNSSPNSASSSEASQECMKLDDLMNSDSLAILTAALEKKVPWQKHIVPQIATPILKNRSGSIRRESWLFFLGPDQNGKEMMAKELAKIVFGSHDDFVAIGNSRFSSSTRDRDNSTEEKEEEEVVSVRKKRARNEHGGSVYDRFLEAVRDNPSRVFYVEDVDEFDRGCLRGFERAMKEGSVSSVVGDGGEALLLKDAIVIFSCDHGEENHDDQNQRGSLDLNVATINEDGNSSLSGIRILDSVDMQVVFRIQVL